MANAAGMYGLTLEKFFIDTMGMSLESETLVKVHLVQNAYTPDFDAHNFRDDTNVNEPGASGTYALGGSVLTSTDLTPASPAATQLKYAGANLSWTSATITARGAIGYHVTGGAASTDPVIWDSDFGGDVSSTAGTFSITWHANGIFFVDYA